MPGRAEAHFSNHFRVGESTAQQFDKRYQTLTVSGCEYSKKMRPRHGSAANRWPLHRGSIASSPASGGICYDGSYAIGQMKATMNVLIVGERWPRHALAYGSSQRVRRSDRVFVAPGTPARRWKQENVDIPSDGHGQPGEVRPAEQGRPDGRRPGDAAGGRHGSTPSPT